VAHSLLENLRLKETSAAYLSSYFYLLSIISSLMFLSTLVNYSWLIGFFLFFYTFVFLSIISLEIILGHRSFCSFCATSLIIFLIINIPAKAETLNEALSRSYLTNPELEAQRADTRGVDENLPISRGAFLPQASVQSTGGIIKTALLNNENGLSYSGVTGSTSAYANDLSTTTNPVTGVLVANLNIFNGFRGLNGINQAEARIRQSREILRNTEIQVFNNVVNAYLNVMRDSAIFRVREDYLKVLVRQEEITKEGVEVGELTRTDLLQVQTALSRAKQDLVAIETVLKTDLSVYEQFTGKLPVKLAPVTIRNSLLPKNEITAQDMAQQEHPLIISARYNVEINEYNVKIQEGQLLPTVNIQGVAGQQWNYFGTAGQRLFQGGGYIQVNIPLYEGGINYGQIRQAKEKLGQARALYDQQIRAVRQTVSATWAAWMNSERYLTAAKEQVSRAEATLTGVRAEAKLGQRTTWDILNYMSTLINARQSLIIAQRERIISSYNVLAAIGRLSAEQLDLDVAVYQASTHYNRVKNQFIGTEPWQ
jgi:outer membrane protein